MAGKHTLLMTAELLLVMLPLMVAPSLSAPLTKRSETGSDSELVLENIEAYFRMIVESVHFPATELSLELKDTLFESHVCPVFHMHSRIQQLQEVLLESNQSNQTESNLSFLSFITETQTQALCARAKNNCSEGQHCYNMSCNISSIAESCLSLMSLGDETKELWGEQRAPVDNSKLVPLWLGELFETEQPSQSTQDILHGILAEMGFVDCTFPRYEDVEEDDQEIRCCWIIPGI